MRRSNREFDRYFEEVDREVSAVEQALADRVRLAKITERMGHEIFGARIDESFTNQGE